MKLCSALVVLFHLQTPSKKKVEISTVSSNYHIEMNPRSEGTYEL